MKKATGKSNLSIIQDYVSGNRPFVQVGYESNLENSKRKEGEEWEDAQGNKWVMKNGYKKRISKKATIAIEQKCSICASDMKWGNYLDHRIYPKTGRCYECNIIFDSKMKILGSYEKYEKYKIYNNMLSEMNEFKRMLEEGIEYIEKNKDNKLQFFNDDGSSEFWTDNTDSSQKVLTDLKKDLSEITNNISKINNELSSLGYDNSIEEKAKQLTLEKINRNK